MSVSEVLTVFRAINLYHVWCSLLLTLSHVRATPTAHRRPPPSCRIMLNFINLSWSHNMYYVNVYKKHQLQSRARFFILLNYQRRRDSERLLHEPTTSDRFHASTLPKHQPTQRAEPIRIFRNFFSEERKIGNCFNSAFWCFLATFRAVLTASKHLKQLHFYHF